MCSRAESPGAVERSALGICAACGDGERARHERANEAQFVIQKFNPSFALLCAHLRRVYSLIYGSFYRSHQWELLRLLSLPWVKRVMPQLDTMKRFAQKERGTQRCTTPKRDTMSMITVDEIILCFQCSSSSMPNI